MVARALWYYQRYLASGDRAHRQRDGHEACPFAKFGPNSELRGVIGVNVISAGSREEPAGENDLLGSVGESEASPEP
jgi:hypothetical protein